MAAGLLAALFAWNLPAPPQAARAATVRLVAVADNTLYEPSPPFDPASATANPSNGAGDFVFVGRAAEMNGGLRRRAVLRFDVAEAIPAGAQIIDVSLRLYLSQTITDPVLATDVFLHRLKASWGEGASDASGQEGGGANAAPGDATWLHRAFASTHWQVPGGDFAAQASATAVVGDRNLFYTWSDPRMIDEVRGWRDAPWENFGWILLGDESVPATAKRFDSRDSFSFDLLTNERTVPVLTVTHAPIPEPGAAVLVWLAGGLLCRRRKVGLFWCAAGQCARASIYPCLVRKHLFFLPPSRDRRYVSYSLIPVVRRP